MFKNILNYAMAAYLAFCPYSADSAYAKSNYSPHHIHQITETVDKAKVYAFRYNPRAYQTKVISAPYVFSSKNKEGTYVATGKNLEQIVGAYESIEGRDIELAINGGFFDVKNNPYEAVGREVIESQRFRTKAAKKVPSKTSYRAQFSDYDFKHRASLYIDQSGIVKIGYFNDISKAKYFFAAGPMLVEGGKDVWRERYVREQFDKAYLAPYKRSVVAVTKKGDIMLVATEKITLDKLTRFLLRMGAKDAMCLDSGSSVQLLYDTSKKGNDLIIGNPRNIINGIAVIKR
ncbi:MAG: phosphodiester glycosidase family protein [Candidatus Woesearchaeota archaeon]